MKYRNLITAACGDAPTLCLIIATAPFPTNFGHSACNSVKVQPISTLRLPNHARSAAELPKRLNCLHYFRNACTASYVTSPVKGVDRRPFVLDSFVSYLSLHHSLLPDWPDRRTCRHSCGSCLARSSRCSPCSRRSSSRSGRTWRTWSRRPVPGRGWTSCCRWCPESAEHFGPSLDCCATQLRSISGQ